MFRLVRVSSGAHGDEGVEGLAEGSGAGDIAVKALGVEPGEVFCRERDGDGARAVLCCDH